VDFKYLLIDKGFSCLPLSSVTPLVYFFKIEKNKNSQNQSVFDSNKDTLVQGFLRKMLRTRFGLVGTRFF